MNATTAEIQSAEASAADKWTQGVMDLIKMTQEGKLDWRRTTEPSDLYAEEYVAEFRANRLTLRTTDLLSDFSAGQTVWYNPPYQVPRTPVSRRNPSLTVTRSGQLVTSFPDVAALRGLKQAVRAHVSSKDDAFLQIVHDALT